MRAQAASLGAPAAAPAPAPPRAAAPPPANAPARSAGPEFVDPEAEDEGPRGGAASSLASPIEAAKAERRNGERSEADAEIARWDARIQAVQREMSQARDQRTRAVLGNLLANLVLGAARVLTGTRGSSTIPMRQDAFEERARERLQDRSREWGATDDMILRAQELREGQRTRATESDSRIRDREAARALDARRLDLDERRLGMQEAGADDERSQRQALLDRTMEERRQRTDASSELSQAYQQTMRQRIETYRATGNTQLADSLERIYGGERLGSMSAEQLETALGRTGGLPQVHMRGRAGGGGGAGTSRDRSALFAEAESVGIPRAAAETMTERELARAVEMRGRRSGDAEQGEMILPGVQAGPGLTSPGEAREMRRGFSQARAQMGALSEIERVATRYGASAAIDRRAAGELAAPVASLRAMVAHLQNTGVINPSEAPAIEAMLPNPQSLSQMTFGDLQNRLRSFRGALERGIDAELLARGVDDAGRRSAIEMLRGRGTAPRGASTPASTDQRFTVTRPDGRSTTRPLTPEQAQRLRDSGYTVTEAR
jgi:hypothetical protein